MKLSRLKKFLGRVLLCLFLISNLGPSVDGFADSDSYTSYEIQQITSSHLNTYSSSMTIYATELGLINSLSNIMRFYMWTDYMCSVDSGIAKFSNDEKKYYSEILRKRIKSFNDKFKEPSDFAGLELPVFDEGKYPNEMQTMVNKASEYIKAFYDVHAKAFNELENEGDKEKYYKENSSSLDGMYYLMLRLKQDYQLIGTLLPYQTNSVYKVDFSTLDVIVSTQDYLELLKYSLESINRDINTETEVTLNDSDDWITKFSKIDAQGEKEEVVNNAWLLCYSASSLYLPMESIVGDNYVVDAIKHLSADDSVAEAYVVASTFKKPLYMRETKNGEPKGSGTSVTLADFINSVINREDGSLVTIEGQFEPSEDGNSYQTNKGNSVTRYNTGDEAGTYATDNPSEEEKDKEEKDEEKTSQSLNDTYVNEDTGDVTVLESTLPESSNFTSSIFSWGKDNGVRGATNTAVVSNYFLNNNLIDLDGELAQNSALFVNPFGDIVLSDNTVVIPAAANATLYVDDDSVIYNPFTEMFMAGYPQITKSKTLTSAKSVDNTGKYIFTTARDFEDDATGIFNGSYIFYSNLLLGDFKMFQMNKKSLSFKFGWNTMPLDTGLYSLTDSTKMNIFKPESKDLTGLSGWFQEMETNAKFFYRMDYNTITVEDINAPLYPYGNSDGDEGIARAKYLVESFYTSLVSDNDGVINKNAGRVNDSLMYEILVNALNGRQNTTGYQQTFVDGITDLESKGLFYKITKYFIDACDSIIGVFEGTPGILGVRDATQDYVMGNFLYYAKIVLPYFIVVIAIFFLGNYIRRRLDVIYSVLGFLFTTFLVVMSIYFFPRYLATAANFLTANQANALAFTALEMRQESNMGNALADSTYEGMGTFNYATSSITLYKFNDTELKSICSDYGCDYSTVVSGGALVLDEDSGLYIEGDSLKINLDNFFNLSSIVGTTEVDGNKVSYTLKVNKNVSSVIDYYLPYNLIVDSLVEQLNTLSSVYSIPRDQMNYNNSIRKDKFLMSSFIYSPVFLCPTDYKEADDTMTEGLLEELINAFGETNVDFLGIADILEAVNSGAYSGNDNDYQDSLWYMTMVQNGYFDSSSVSESKFNSLVEYVNYHTKKFLIDNRDYFNYMCDENIIEITALYANIIFNYQISEFTNVLYPQYLNFEAFSVTDILRAVVVTDVAKYASMKRSLVEYSYSAFGILGMLAVTLCIVLSALTSILLNVSVYVLYLLLLIFILVRMLMGRKLKDAFLGYVKSFVSIMLILFLNIVGTKLISDLTSEGLTLLMLLFLYAISFTLTSSILWFILTGLGSMDFGSVKVDSIIKGIKTKINPFRRDNEKIHVQNIKANRLVTSDDANYNIMLGDDDLISSIAMDNFIKSRYSDYNSSNLTEMRKQHYTRKRKRSLESKNYNDRFIYEE